MHVHAHAHALSHTYSVSVISLFYPWHGPLPHSFLNLLSTCLPPSLFSLFFCMLARGAFQTMPRSDFFETHFVRGIHFCARAAHTKRTLRAFLRAAAFGRRAGRRHGMAFSGGAVNSIILVLLFAACCTSVLYFQTIQLRAHGFLLRDKT